MCVPVSCLKTTFKLTQGRISRIVFSIVDLAESDNFSKYKYKYLLMKQYVAEPFKNKYYLKRF